MSTDGTAPGLLLLGGASEMTLSVDVASAALIQARTRGLRTHLTNQQATLHATAAVGEFADTSSAVDLDQPEKVARWARERAEQGECFDVVLGVREMAQVAVADTAEALGLPGNPPHAVRRVRNKDECRIALAEAGFRQPSVRLCTKLDDAIGFLAETTGPWVVKPRDAMGSEGVGKVSDPTELPAAVAALPDKETFLVEEFVEGPEFSVEGVFLAGTPTVLAITGKEKLPANFVEIGHVLPAVLPEATRQEIESQVTAALTALELRFGVFHVELWLADSGVVLGEVHVRVGGDWIHRLLGYSIPDLDLFGLIYDDVLGRSVTRDLTPTRAAAARFLSPPSGRLVEIEGWDEVVDHPAVLHAECAVEPGMVIEPVRESNDRAGVVLVGAETADEARELALKLVSSLRFVVESADGLG